LEVTIWEDISKAQAIREYSHAGAKEAGGENPPCKNRISKDPLLRDSHVCGKPGCRCMEGKPHGPFWYLSRRIEGKTRYTYIPKDKAKEVKALHRQ